jgi:hypothetical protein
MIFFVAKNPLRSGANFGKLQSMQRKRFHHVVLTMFSAVLVASPLMAEVKKHTHAGLSIVCEAKFTPGEPIKGDDPSNPLVTMEIHSAKTDVQEITLVKTVYRAGTELNLTGAAKGAAAAVGRTPGVTKPMQAIADAKVKGAEAKRLSFSATKDGKKFGIEALYILKGSTIWTAQVLFESDEESQQQAEKLLSTVTLAP